MNHEQFIFDLEQPLTYIENILKKYVLMPDNCTYLKGVRLPVSNLSNIDTYRKNNMVSHTPYHPITAPYIVKEMLLLYIRDLNPNQSLIYSNVMNTNCGGELYPTVSNMTNETIVMGQAPGITTEDFNTIMEYYNNLAIHVKTIIEKTPAYVFNISIESNRFILYKLVDIKAFRYQELIDAIDKPVRIDCDTISDTVSMDAINALEGFKMMDDCGNGVYIEQYIRECDFKHVIGKRFLNMNNMIETLSPRHQYVINTTIRIRSPHDCKLIATNKLCAACSGAEA